MYNPAAMRGNGEGTVKKRSDGRWEARYRLNGKPVSIYAHTQKEVLTQLRLALRLIDEGRPLSQNDVTVKKYLERWLKEDLAASGLRKATLDNYAWAVDKIIDSLGHRKIRDLSVTDVETFLRGLSVESRSSRARIHSTLTKALRHAQRRGIVYQNVAMLADTPSGTVRVRRSLTREQAETLLEISEGHRLRPLILTGLYLGLRPGELAGLRWKDVDLVGGVLRIRVSRSGPLKTKRSQRTLAMPAVVVDELKGIERYGDLVFPTSVGGMWDKNNLRREFAELTEKAGLGIWTPYELRHSCASLLSAAHVPLIEIADLLGQGSTRMLEQHYRHNVEPTIRTALLFPEA